MIYGIDFGTSYTRIYKRGAGIVFNQPTVLCKNGDRYLYFGERAIEAVGKGHRDLDFVYPVRRGLIEEPDIAAAFLKFCLSSSGLRASLRPDVYTVAPVETPSIYRKVYKDVLTEVGFRRVHVLNACVATARLLGSYSRSCKGWLVVHVGAGHIDFGLVSMGDLVDGQTVSLGGLDINCRMQRVVLERAGLRIGEQTAELLKRTISCLRDSGPVAVRGIKDDTGLPAEMEIPSQELVVALRPFLSALFKGLREILGRVPPELCEDILTQGLVLSGGGAELKDLDKLIERFFNLRVVKMEQACQQVIKGLGLCVDGAGYFSFPRFSL